MVMKMMVEHRRFEVVSCHHQRAFVAERQCGLVPDRPREDNHECLSVVRVIQYNQLMDSSCRSRFA